MMNKANITSFNIGWCVALSLASVITLSPAAEAATISNSPHIGAACSRETQGLPGSLANGGGVLICMKDKSGLHWQDLRNKVANAHLNSILPKCSLDAFYLPVSKVSPEHLKIFTRLATAYFSKRHLLPIKIVKVKKAVKKYMTVGIHICSNGLASQLGAWSGFMPLNASEGWSVYTMHKVAGFGNSLFLQMVKIGSSYKIVGATTSP